MSKTGNSVIVASPEGAQYSRNTTYVRKFVQNESNTEMPLSDSVIKTPETEDSGTAPDLKLVSPTQSLADTDPVATPSAANEQPSPRSARPKRQCGMHPKYKDFVLN